MISKYLKALQDAGQSVWCDNLSKTLLDSGDLARLIDLGVTGLTSNPTIFNKAIAGTSDYDTDIKTLCKAISKVDDLAEALFVADVGRAADLLRPTYDRTRGEDGYASIEVSPTLAANTKETVQAGVRLWRSLARPNIMIKVPATQEGVPAIRELLEQGINVNVTLIFSVEVYADVINAYVEALEARAARGEDISQLASVASFFVSRVDSIVEKELKGKESSPEAKAIIGKVGIANSKLAYELFENQFQGARFKKLADKKARVQWPLWASTGTKNPAYSPVMYVNALAAPHTVNTMPPATIEAVLQGVEIENNIRDYDEARKVMEGVKKAGLDFSKLLTILQGDGVKLFAESYEDLIQSLAGKQKSLA